MDAIIELTEINFTSLFISVFIILFGTKAIVSIFEWMVDKLGLETKWMRRRREEHLLLIQTSQNLSALQIEMKQFVENRIHDREQSLQIQKELTDSIKYIADKNSAKDRQIDNLMIAQREVLTDKINEKYKYYISINGIPEDEVEEFTNLHNAYKGVGGNHSGDAKYEYCMRQLPVIPVETRLVVKTVNE